MVLLLDRTVGTLALVSVGCACFLFGALRCTPILTAWSVWVLGWWVSGVAGLGLPLDVLPVVLCRIS